MSRTVNGERLFADEDKEHLRREIWLVAEYCGVQVLTYAILSNHFHIVVRVPQKTHIHDEELLRRYALLYPKPGKYRAASLSVIESQLRANGPEAERWRAQQVAQMGDVSAYVKLVKQRFSTAFNARHHRFGTLWSERFRSEVVESGSALRVVLAYVDLNPVRAGLVNDPKDYRFCGYAEAVAGRDRAKEAICWALGETWDLAAPHYRLMLFGAGAIQTPDRHAIPDAMWQNIAAQRGELKLSEALRCRMRFLTDTGILGSKLFIEEMKVRCGIHRTRSSPEVNIPGVAGLYALRALRRRDCPASLTN